MKRKEWWRRWRDGLQDMSSHQRNKKKKNEIKLIDLSLARKVLSLWILMIDTITIVTNFLRGRESRRGSS